MTYYGAKELAGAFRTVRKNTLLIAEEIPEDKYGFRATPETRTVAHTLVHIALSTRLPYLIHAIEKRTTLEGFDFPAFFIPLIAESEQPRTKEQILAMLREEEDKIGNWLAGLSEEFLAQSVTSPPGITPASKSRFEMLLSIKEHEMHHRAQLMVMQRMIGLTPHLTRQMEARIAEMLAAKATA